MQQCHSEIGKYIIVESRVEFKYIVEITERKLYMVVCTLFYTIVVWRMRISGMERNETMYTC